MTHIADSERNVLPAPISAEMEAAVADAPMVVSVETGLRLDRIADSETVPLVQPNYTDEEAEALGGWDKIQASNGEVQQPTPFPTRLHDKVAICGFAEGHRDAAPWADNDIEFWGINRLWSVLEKKPWSRWFELHSLEDFYKEDNDHKVFLQQLSIPIYVRPQDLVTAAEWEIPNATPYPLERVLAQYTPYFTNTISWLMALAISMEFKEIQLFGVDMAQDSIFQAEYSMQRPSCEWLVGYAQAAGIQVVLPPGSDLMKTSHLYGFDSDAYQQKGMARLQEVGQRKENIRSEMKAHADKAEFLKFRISELDGAMAEIQYNLRNLITPKAEGKPHGS